jgi:hydroxymethylpyrimidine pyrophosphatase-like HAD family hydrolase
MARPLPYPLLATDFDGTLAHNAAVSSLTIVAVERFRRSGRKLVLVSGRILRDLQGVFDRLDLFDRVVVENGATMYQPETRQERRLAGPVPRKLLEALRARNIPFDTGRCILATREPHQDDVVAAIRESGLPYEVIFNKGAVMILPAGVNKGTGLECALQELAIPEGDVVAVGDAENDEGMFSVADFAVAVANALPRLRRRAHLVTRHAASEGVQELIELILNDELPPSDPRSEDAGTERAPTSTPSRP